MDGRKIDLNGDRFGAFIRPCPGESRSGDAVVAVETDAGVLLAIIDALGHGGGAADVASRAVTFLEDRGAERGLEDLVRGVDNLLRGGGTASGAALGLCTVDRAGSVRYVGVGNTTTRVVSGLPRELRRLFSKDGTVGQAMPTPAPQNAQLAPGDLLVFTTDGIQTRLDHDRGPGDILDGSAHQIATDVVRCFGKDYDDAACLVYRHD